MFRKIFTLQNVPRNEERMMSIMIETQDVYMYIQ